MPSITAGSLYLAGSIGFTTLLRIHDVSADAITSEQLNQAAMSVEAPAGGESGQCLPWALRVVEELHRRGLLSLASIDALGIEFDEFAYGNRSYARRNQLPNVKISVNCA